MRHTTISLKGSEMIKTNINHTVKRIAILMPVIFITACAWKHPYKNQVSFNQDQYSCQQKAAKMYPPQANTTYETDCTSLQRGSTSCTTNARQGPDTNVNGRNIAFGNCMRAEGWELGFEK